jgi:hypothetical protein
MRKIVAWTGTIIGIGEASLSKANSVANHLGFLSLPDDVRGALIAMSHIPMLVTSLLLIVGIACLIFLIHDYGLDKALLQWAQKATARVGHGAPALDDVLSRLAVTERSIAQNKSGLEELRVEVAMLTRSLRARDAESIIKEADQVIMPTSKRLLQEPYPDETSWAADCAVWERAMMQIDNLMSQWQPHDKPFLDIRLNDLEGAPAPPQQSNIKSDTNINRYKTVWVTQQRYDNRREVILQYLFFKAGELPG